MFLIPKIVYWLPIKEFKLLFSITNYLIPKNIFIFQLIFITFESKYNIMSEQTEYQTIKIEEHQITLNSKTDQEQIYKLRKLPSLELGTEYIFLKGNYFML